MSDLVLLRFVVASSSCIAYDVRIGQHEPSTVDPTRTPKCRLIVFTGLGRPSLAKTLKPEAVALRSPVSLPRTENSVELDTPSGGLASTRACQRVAGLWVSGCLRFGGICWVVSDFSGLSWICPRGPMTQAKRRHATIHAL